MADALEAPRLGTDYPIQPVPFTRVTLEDSFWRPRLEKNRAVTIPAVFRKCEEAGRMDNFLRAAGKLPGPYVGSTPFEDTDVYKAVEGASYSLSLSYDKELDDYLDKIVAMIADAQEPDGYLYTSRTVDPAHPHAWSGPERWSNLVMSHELYNCGHLYEAAAAHFHATGKRSLLNVALKSADLICKTFGNGHGKKRDVPGHQIIEMGFAKLYRITGERRYLEQAKFFLDERGKHDNGRTIYGHEDNPGYSQDHIPVLEQDEAVGHAVRAVYMYSGMSDVAALFPDEPYAVAANRIWKNVVDTKVYLTGGLGARHKGEAFGENFELGNAGAYAETCAAIGSVMWQQRLFSIFGKAEYYDVLEQTLYNGLIAGISLSGDQYFYVNPLESDGSWAFNYGAATRNPWFDVSCCPTNLARFFPSLPGYVYANSADTLYVNLFIASTAETKLAGVPVKLSQKSNYPWDGAIKIQIDPEKAVHGTLKIRIPGWLNGRIMGGTLYQGKLNAGSAAVQTAKTLKARVNGAHLEGEVVSDGWLSDTREWKKGDVIELDLPLEVQLISCDPRVSDNKGKLAIQRGPVVYCVEQHDAKTPLENLRLDHAKNYESQWNKDLLGGIMTVNGPDFTAVPYYAWSNRGPVAMKVWISKA